MAFVLAKRGQLLFQRGGVGHIPGRRGQRGNIDSIQSAFLFHQRLRQILGGEDADDVLRMAAPKRQTAVMRRDHGVQQLALGQVGIEAHHVGAMKHHIAHFQFPQIQNAADHVAVFAFDIAFAQMQFDRAADFLMRLFAARLFTAHAEQRQYPPYQPLHRDQDWRKQGDRPAQRGRDKQRDTIGARYRQRLGQGFHKDQDHHRHDRGGHRHGARTVKGLQGRGRQG